MRYQCMNDSFTPSTLPTSIKHNLSIQPSTPHSNNLSHWLIVHSPFSLSDDMIGLQIISFPDYIDVHMFLYYIMDIDFRPFDPNNKC